MANIPFLSRASLKNGNTETSLRVAGLSRRPKDGLYVAVSRMRDLRRYALRQSAGSIHIEAVAAHRGDEPDGRFWFSYRWEMSDRHRGLLCVDPITIDENGQVQTGDPSDTNCI